MPTESGGEAGSGVQASEPTPPAQNTQPRGTYVVEGVAERLSAPEPAHNGAPPVQRPPQPQLHATPFQLRALLPPSSSTTDSSSPESTLSQRLPTMPGQDGAGDSGSRLGAPASSPLRGGRPPLPAPQARLPSAALLGGASSISIASPFMQQQILSALSSEGSSRWRSNGGFTSTSSSGPPSCTGAAAEAAAGAAPARAAPPAEPVALPSGEEAEEDSAPTPPPEVEPAAWHTHMATVAEDGEDEGEAVPTPLQPRPQPAALGSDAAAPAPPAQPAAGAPRPPNLPSAEPPSAQAQAAFVRPSISDWGPLPDDVARLPPAQQAAVHAAAAGEAALVRQLAPAPASEPAPGRHKRGARGAAVTGQPPASGSPRQLAADGSPRATSAKSSSRGGSLSSSGGRSAGSGGRGAAAPQPAGTAAQQEQLLPAVAELPSQIFVSEALPGSQQAAQTSTPEAGALQPLPHAQPLATAQLLPPSMQGTAAGQPGAQPLPPPPPPISPQISQRTQISLQPLSAPGYGLEGLSAWQAPLAAPAAPQLQQVGAGAVPAGPWMGSPQASPPLGATQGFAASPSPSQTDSLAAQQQLLQLQAAAAGAAAQQHLLGQREAGALAAVYQQEQEQRQQQEREAAASALALHPATAAVLATADPVTREVILAALQQQQEQDAAAAAAGQQQQETAAALAAVQQQQTAFLSAHQQQQQQSLLDSQHRAASEAALGDRQQQQELLAAHQGAQALLASQQHHMQLLLPGQAPPAPLAALLAGSPLQGLQCLPQYAAGAVPQPYLAGMAPPPLAVNASQLPHLQQLAQPVSPAQMDRQLSQALSGYSVGSEPPGAASAALPPPQHPLGALQPERPALHAVLPAGEPPLRYSPSPAVSRDLDGSGVRRGGTVAGGAAARYQHTHARQHPQTQPTAGGPQSEAGLSAFAGPGQHRPRVKAVVSSGGRFVQPGAGGRGSGAPSGGLSTAAAISAAAPGSWTYAGGETRLASLPDACTLLELLAVLTSKKQPAGVAGLLSSGLADTAGGGTAQPGDSPGPPPGSAYWNLGAETTPAGPPSIANSTKGSSAERPGGPAGGTGLASPPSLVSGTDTLGTSALASATAAVTAAAGGRPSGLQKLCIVRYKLPSEPGLFVDVVDDEDVRLMFEEHADWVAEGSISGAVGRKLHIFVEWLPQVPAVRLSAESADSDLRGTAPGQAHFTPSDSSLEEHSPMAQRVSAIVSDLTSNKIEVIPAGDVQLLAHIGAGTFGDTYRGRWHESDVAVKCINPLMIGVQYASRQAWVDFLRDANQMGKLRHGNLCEVYGVVLPHDSDPRLAAPRSRSEPAAPGTGLAAGAAIAPATIDAALAPPPPPPAMAPPSPADGHAQQGGGPPPTGAARLMQREATLPLVASTLPQPLPGPVANPPAIVMEFVAGRSLGSAIAAGSDLVVGRLARVVYALDTAKALSYLHSRKVAHLDLKSGNVLLGWRDRRPTAKIAGYGLTGRKVSMVRSAAQGVTSAASMLPWTAPEVFRTPEYVTGKADVYSFAVLMYELWTLRKPFEGQDAMELLARVQAGEMVRPVLPGEGGEPYVEEPGPGWRELLERCWAEDPEQRPDFSVIEEELRSIAREMKRQQGPARPRAPAAAQAQQPRSAPRTALPPGLPRPRSGTNLAAAVAQEAAGGVPAAADPVEAQQAERLARPGSGFLISRLPGSGVWAPSAGPLPKGEPPPEAEAGWQLQHAAREAPEAAARGADAPAAEHAGAAGAGKQEG